jgi:hypothetical protein
MLKIRGMSIVENFLKVVNRFSQCLTVRAELRGGPGGHPLAHQPDGRPNPISVGFMVATSAPARDCVRTPCESARWSESTGTAAN